MEQQLNTTQNESNVRQNVSSELSKLRTEMERMVEDLRMKSKTASAEAQNTVEALDAEVKRFAGDIADAADDTRDDLRKVGRDLRMRIQKLTNQVKLPS
jgi:hypothetical protein